MRALAKSLTILSVCAFTAPAYAMFPGINLGVQVGAIQLGGKHKYYTGSPTSGETLVNAKGGCGGAFAGFAFEIGGPTKIVIGGDAYYNMNSVSSNNNLSVLNGPLEGTFSVSHTSTMGAGAIVGLLINPKIVAYVGPGFEMNKYTLSYTQLTYGTVPQETYKLKSSGFVARLGAAMAMSKSFYVGLEYNFPITRKLKPRSDQVKINGANRGYTFKPIEHRLMIRLAFRI